MRDRQSSRGAGRARFLRAGFLPVVALALTALFAAGAALAQNYRFNAIEVEGNLRIETSTILTYVAIEPGDEVSPDILNNAYQRVLASGLFESVSVEPAGSRLVVRVAEFPTINRVAFEGNSRIKDDALEKLARSKPRQVFNPGTAEADVALIAEAYEKNGRIAARVTPKIIRRSENRVDLIFEIFEGKGIEIQRVGFVGNRAYSDRRLRRVVESKQAGLLRAVVARDTYAEDRLDLDRQVLTEFYQSRGYVDFRVTGTSADLTRNRDGYFVTFNIEEGQRFEFGEITTRSAIAGVDPEIYQDALKIKTGAVYSPALVRRSVERMERLGLQEGVDFLRVEPLVTRNERDLTLDLEFVLRRGQRQFIERIDIKGNTTTLDRVIRRQFDTVEGDPFNARAIQRANRRIQGLRYFSGVGVDARTGSRPELVVVDVNVTETTTGSLTLGGSFSSDGGLGFNSSFSERNFLGRGQGLNAKVDLKSDRATYSFDFLRTRLSGKGRVVRALHQPRRNRRRQQPLRHRRRSPSARGLASPQPRTRVCRCSCGPPTARCSTTTGISSTLRSEVALGKLFALSAGGSIVYDNRSSGLNPNAGVRLEARGEYAGLAGDQDYFKASVRLAAQTRILQEEVILRSTFEAGGDHLPQRHPEPAPPTATPERSSRGFNANGIGPGRVRREARRQQVRLVEARGGIPARASRRVRHLGRSLLRHRVDMGRRHHRTGDLDRVRGKTRDRLLAVLELALRSAADGFLPPACIRVHRLHSRVRPHRKDGVLIMRAALRFGVVALAIALAPASARPQPSAGGVVAMNLEQVFNQNNAGASACAPITPSRSRAWRRATTTSGFCWKPRRRGWRCCAATCRPTNSASSRIPSTPKSGESGPPGPGAQKPLERSWGEAQLAFLRAVQGVLGQMLTEMGRRRAARQQRAASGDE